jgi:AT hook motif
MAFIHDGITGRGGNDLKPLAVTVAKACELSGLGPTSIWAFLKSGRLEAVRLPGVRRTLVNYTSLARLLSPSSDAQARKRGRPRKIISTDVRRWADERTLQK